MDRYGYRLAYSRRRRREFMAEMIYYYITIFEHRAIVGLSGQQNVGCEEIRWHWCTGSPPTGSLSWSPRRILHSARNRNVSSHTFDAYFGCSIHVTTEPIHMWRRMSMRNIFFFLAKTSLLWFDHITEDWYFFCDRITHSSVSRGPQNRLAQKKKKNYVSL